MVPNKFPVLGIEGDLEREGEGLFDKMQGIGAHEVVIESPDHILNISELKEKAVEQVLWAFRDRVRDLKNDKRLRAFESRTGKVLWETKLDTEGHTNPMTYLGRNGKQYVVIVSSGLNAFALE